MFADPATWWSGSLHLSFRLLGQTTPSLAVFLGADGLTPQQVLSRLPYQAARAGAQASPSQTPDARRYRDAKSVYQTLGLVFESDGIVHVTELGRAVERWMGLLTPVNAPVLGRHAAYALAAAQLRNPLSQAGRSYPPDVRVFPFSVLWRAALALEDRISSDEINRVIMKVSSEDDLKEAIVRIETFRASPQGPEDLAALGVPVVDGARANDRIVVWVSLASFGYLLIQDKQESGSDYYTIRPSLRTVVVEAAAIKRQHREFSLPETYVRHLSDSACLPKDLR